MIQIQDDAAVASANPNNSPSMPTSAYVPPANSDVNTASHAPVSSQTSAPADNSAEIDRLLAELDKLSKGLEAEKQTAAAPVAEPVAESSAAAPEPSAAPSMSESPADAKPAAEGEDKFDFDAFLSDLEKKIDQEAAKNQSAAPSQTSTDTTQTSTPVANNDTLEESDFRKNRSSLDLATEDKAEVPEDEAISNPPSADQALQAEKAAADNSDSEDLKSQNIFEMLGLSQISDEEKNQFLDELEMMIWDDFVMHDLELLLTSEEYGQARQLLDDASKSEDERKEALVIFLEKLIPDLDEVLYEKALELKSEMMAERLSKLKENTDSSVTDKVKQAEMMISQNKWRSAASLLNNI